MSSRWTRCLTMSCALAVTVLTAALRADDWPAFRGPDRDGICREKGLLKEWPKDGPKLLWKTTGLGIGNSTPSVVGNVLYIMGQKDDKEWVMALDVAQGKQIWASAIGPIRNNGSGFPGPRSTPSIDGNRLYTLGIAGDIVCMNVKNGRILWHRDMVKDYGGTLPNWGYAESVLVDGPWVICTPGGKKNTIAALNKNNGRLVWGSPVGDPADYASVIKVMIGNSKQYVNLTRKGVIGVAARTASSSGATMPRPAEWPTARPASPRAIRSLPPAATASAADWSRIEPSGGGFTAKASLFHQENAKPPRRHGSGGRLPLRLQQPERADLPRLRDGQGEMDRPQFGQMFGALGRRDALLPQRARADQPGRSDADGFRLKGRFDQPDRSERNSWPYLVIANGVMYVRDQDVLLAYDVRGEQ